MFFLKKKTLAKKNLEKDRKLNGDFTVKEIQNTDTPE